MRNGEFFIAHLQSAKRMQPGYRAFNNPAGSSQSAAMRRSAFCQLGAYGVVPQYGTQRLRIVAAITLQDFGFANGSATLSRNRRDGLNQWKGLGNVVCIGPGQDRRKRDAFLLGNDVVLAAKLTPIDGTRSRFFPANIARTDELSTMARARSTWPRSRNSASNASWIRCQTPASCHCTNRRQQAVPDPHPISCGSRFHGIPERNTNTMPVKIARSSVGLRPAYCRLRDARLGNNGSIRLHNKSSISSLGIALHPEKTRQKVNTVRQKLTALFASCFNFATVSKRLLRN